MRCEATQPRCTASDIGVVDASRQRTAPGGGIADAVVLAWASMNRVSWTAFLRDGATDMDKQRALSLIEEQIQTVAGLEYVEDNPIFDKWRRDTRVVLEKIFGRESKHVKEFESIRYRPNVAISDSDQQHAAWQEAFEHRKSQSLSFLESALTEIRQFWDDDVVGTEASGDPLAAVQKLCSRFHPVAKQLRRRHCNRSTLEINDEYDVQDLLHALLKVDFEDIRPEEWTPSYAGKSARMDFLIKDHQIVVEIKKARQGLADKEVGEQLIVDIARYRTHADCRKLVCFVYDPEEHISNPAGLERDLSCREESLEVVVIVASR